MSRIASETYKYWTPTLLWEPNSTSFFKLQCPHESFEDLDTMQMRMWSGMGLRLCISNQVLGNADVAGPWATVWIAGHHTLLFTCGLVFCRHGFSTEPVGSTPLLSYPTARPHSLVTPLAWPLISLHPISLLSPSGLPQCRLLRGGCCCCRLPSNFSAQTVETWCFGGRKGLRLQFGFDKYLLFSSWDLMSLTLAMLYKIIP